jgi:hypothetical protein
MWALNLTLAFNAPLFGSVDVCFTGYSVCYGLSRFSCYPGLELSQALLAECVETSFGERPLARSKELSTQGSGMEAREP